MTHHFDHAQQDIEEAEEKVSFCARAVALKRGAILGVVGFGLAYGVHRGWIAPSLSDSLKGDTEALLSLASTVGAGAWIHRDTTPAAQKLQPTNSDGQKLVPAGTTASVQIVDHDDSSGLAEVMAEPEPTTNGATS